MVIVRLMVMVVAALVAVCQVFDQKQIGVGGAGVGRCGRWFFDADMMNVGALVASAGEYSVRQTARLLVLLKIQFYIAQEVSKLPKRININ